MVIDKSVYNMKVESIYISCAFTEGRPDACHYNKEQLDATLRHYQELFNSYPNLASIEVLDALEFILVEEGELFDWRSKNCYCYLFIRSDGRARLDIAGYDGILEVWLC